MSAHLTIDPIKLSQPAGASLAFMGIKGCVPLWHGAQGCTAFAKILFIQHFREPMPFQTTALTHINVVMGGENNIAEAVENLKSKTRVIAIHTTGIGETSGVDLKRAVRNLRAAHPELMIIGVGTSDYEGSLETGYVKAAQAALDAITKPRSAPRRKQVFLAPGPYITPAEVNALKEYVEMFGLRPVAFPDLGDSLSGWLNDAEYNAGSIGGTPVDEITTLSDSAHVITIGSSMRPLGESFAKTHGIEVSYYDNLAMLDEVDDFFALLSRLSGAAVPQLIRRARRGLQDALLDTHFYLGGITAALAGDPEFLDRWRGPLADIGVNLVSVSSLTRDRYPSGGLLDFERAITGQDVALLIGNSHVAELAGRLRVPAVRAGIPVYDRIGEPQRVRLGYGGAASLYMEAANAVMSGARHTAPYVSSLPV
ncbi:MAG: nitrogenase iron-molybdenum cofactor biosynthesis protein NifN [Nitrospinae bacterium]|nr:nitrogenase iron-molybdenum cofactor biosynthesis protein NifN [Nitrospinota bacterium]